jgi:hypothetical protein
MLIGGGVLINESGQERIGHKPNANDIYSSVGHRTVNTLLRPEQTVLLSNSLPE